MTKSPIEGKCGIKDTSIGIWKLGSDTWRFGMRSNIFERICDRGSFHGCKSITLTEVYSIGEIYLTFE